MPLGQRLARQMVEDDRRVGQIVEHRLQLLVEERQPVLHAGKAPAFADRGIERVVARRRAEGLDIAAAEAADRLRRQRHLAHRLQRRPACAGRWCAGWRRRRRGSSPACRRRNRDAAAPPRRARRGRECRRARRIRRRSRTVGTRSKPERLQPRHQRVHVDLVAGPGAEGPAPRRRSAGGMRCSSALAVVSTIGAMRLSCQRDHRSQRVEPARRGVGARRDAVVRQAVPGRQFQHRQARARRRPAPRRSPAGAGRRARRTAAARRAPSRRRPAASANAS